MSVKNKWNYRVCKETIKFKVGNAEQSMDRYSIREVYYDDAGKIFTHDVVPEEVSGDSVDLLKEKMRLMQLAFSKHTVDLDTL